MSFVFRFLGGIVRRLQILREDVLFIQFLGGFVKMLEFLGDDVLCSQFFWGNRKDVL